jgi:arginine decarboxylase
MYWAICAKILDIAPDGASDELNKLQRDLVDTYFCNFSLFQSMPDSWAIDQLFPILPIHRLTEEPTRRGVLADITCDSDGKIDRFVDKRIDKKTLELHELREAKPEGQASGNGNSNGHSTIVAPPADPLSGATIGSIAGVVEPYYLGVFLLGAYQEILGDLHNLLGDTHAVHLSWDAEEGWDIDEVIEGDTVEEVLQYVQYDIADMKRAMRQDIEAACRQGRLTFAEGKSLLKFYDDGLEGYTYLEG